MASFSSNPKLSGPQDRRTANSTASRARVLSSRAGDAEKANVRDDFSPVPSENGASVRGADKGFKRISREFSDKKIERTHVREKIQIQTRSPVKESVAAGNRGERRDKTKPSHRGDAGLGSSGRGHRDAPEGRN
jgi:gamma-tubulin complex component 2